MTETLTTSDPLRHLDAPPSPKGVAVVTGGSAGLGRAVVRELAGAGYDVAVLARGHDGVAGAVRDVAAAGPPWPRSAVRRVPNTSRSRPLRTRSSQPSARSRCG